MSRRGAEAVGRATARQSSNVTPPTANASDVTTVPDEEAFFLPVLTMRTVCVPAPSPP